MASDSPLYSGKFSNTLGATHAASVTPVVGEVKSSVSIFTENPSMYSALPLTPRFRSGADGSLTRFSALSSE